MPTLITIGNATAKGYGFGAASKGNYWVLKTNSGGPFYGITTDSSNNIYWAAFFDNQNPGFGKFNNLGATQFYTRGSGPFYMPNTTKIQVDSSNNAYLTGSHNNGGGTYFSSIIKFDYSGTYQWAYYFNNSQSDIYAYSVSSAIDSSANTLIVGNDYLYAFFIKASSSGSQVFGKRYGSYSAAFKAVKTLGSNYYLFGYSAGGADGNILTIKTDTSGNIIWQKSLTLSPDTTYPRGMGGCVDSSGNTYAFGKVQSTTDTRYFELYYYKCDSSGTLQWQYKISTLYSGNIGYNQEFVYSDVSPDGKIYFATVFTLGGIYGGSTYKIKIHCIDSDGTILWANYLYPTGTPVTLNGLKVDSTGNLFISMSYSYNWIVKIPNDGSLTGVYGDVTYEQSYASGSSASLTNGTTYSMSDYSYTPIMIQNINTSTPSVSTTLTNI